MKIITSKYMLKEIEVTRTWKERLFSFPWHPFRRTKTISVPMDDVYFDRTRGIIYCHPTLLNKIDRNVMFFKGSLVG